MLRIADYTWHQVHSYRLHALPAVFAYVIFRPLIWNTAQRPIPANFLGAMYPHEFNPKHFDLSILHLDQWCDTSHNLRAMPYRVMKQIGKELPQVVIMHGSPDSEENRAAILRLIEDLPVVCNSCQAAKEWDGGEARKDRYGLPQFRTIIHGYDPSEFWSHPVEHRSKAALTICGGGDMSRWYHGIPLVERLKRDVPLLWMGTRGDVPFRQSYDEYLDLLASTLIYFSPTRRAPMPGARSEAMLSGCCVVTVPGNDVEAHIEHGKTGLIVDTYEDARDTIRYLLDHPQEAWEIGQAGRKAAASLFHKDRYVADWLKVLADIGVVVKE